MSNPTSENRQRQKRSVTAVSTRENRRMPSRDKSPSCESNSRALQSSRTSDQGSTSNEKDCVPYWNAQCAAISSRLWSPTETVLHGAVSCSSPGSSNSPEAKSWFSIEIRTAPRRKSPKIFSKSYTTSLAASLVCSDTIRKSNKIRIYPGKLQRATLRRWIGCSRYVYNKTVEYLATVQGTRPSWMEIANNIIAALPEWAKEVPYQIKKIAVRDACRAYTAGKQKCLRTGVPFKLRYRSRKSPAQSIFVPKSSLTLSGVYPRLLGDLKFSEPVDEIHSDCRLVFRQGRWYVTYAIECPRHVAENQGRVVSLDPGVRTFQTFFSEEGCGKIGNGAFSRIARLSVHLDDLLSRMTKVNAKKRRRMKKAADRMRWKIRELISELHAKAARFLVDNFDVILLPTFETSQMARRTARKIRSKTVRAMMSFAHYRFKQHLKNVAFEAGKIVLDVNEAYTSKTVSWTGEIFPNLGGRKFVKSRIDGQTMDRDYNGARGIFLRTLADLPSLRDGRAACIGNVS